MESEKLIAQISSSEETCVDRVSRRVSNNVSVSSRIPKDREFRKKTIKIEGMAKSRFTKLRMQDSFEKLKNHIHFEHMDDFVANIKSNDLIIYSHWTDGVTLKENHLKEDSLKIDDIPRIKNKLRLWVRIFENLSFYHKNNILHGNLKPENILIRDRTSIDSKQIYNSEFFDNKIDIPHVILLDGGYSHFIEYQKEAIDLELIRAHMISEKNIWLAPEAHGFLEGSYKENSDIYSLAAIMAWDFGFIETNNHSVLNSLWSIYNNTETNSFCLGKKIYKCASRNSLSDTLKRLRTILSRALEPMSEKRTISARDIAFEIMLMTNRLVDTVDFTPLEVNDLKTVDDISISSKKEILLKKFELPEKIVPFLMSEEKLESNRLWIEARNKTANKHVTMRSINSGLNIINKSCFYFGVKTIQSKIPFYNLDSFCNNLISYVLHLNPQFLEEIRTIFNDIGTQVNAIFFVLPSLRNYTDKIKIKNENNKNNVIQFQHELVQKNIENFVIKLINASKLNFIIIDDINRSDYSSISIILKLFTHQKINVKWVIGIRLDEDLESEITKNSILQIKHKDLSFASLKDNRTINYWIGKLNSLSKIDARMLSVFSVNPTAIDIETLEILSNKFMSYFTNNIQDTILINEKLQPEIISEDIIPLDEKISVNKVNNIMDVNDEKQNKDNLYLTSEVIKRAINLGILSENRDVISGYIVSYYFEHQFVFQCLSMLLSPNIKQEVNYALFGSYNNILQEGESLAKIIHMSDCLIKSRAPHSHLGAYSLLIIAAKKLCDIYSAEFIIKKLQILEEQIELERPKDASTLITRIREKIGDISRSVNKNEVAVKYYDAVSWNMINRKKIAVLLLKSFFPSQIKNRENRTKEYYRILTVAGKSGFFSELKYTKSLDLKNKIFSIIYKIQRRLSEQNAYLENNDIQINKDIFKNIFVNLSEASEDKIDDVNEDLGFSNYKSTRDKVMSYFLRSCIGWIDNAHIYPYIIESLHFASENKDAESIINLLFSLLLTCERNISLELRSLILETITDLVSRINDVFTLNEVFLLRAWFAFFCDGNLVECKKNIDRLNSSFYELPYSIRQCAKKLQILYEFESLPSQFLSKQKEFSERNMKKFDDYDLKDWIIGYEITQLKNSSISLKNIVGDSLFVGNILNEKLDQILLYSHYIIEQGHANAASLVTNEAKNLNIRQWFVDPSSHIEYISEKLMNNYLENSVIRNFELKNSQLSYKNMMNQVLMFLGDNKKILFSKYLYQINRLFLGRKFKLSDVKLQANYWGEDKAILNNIKLDIAKTQDSEKLHFLAQNFVRTGYFWSGYRVAHKARCDLTLILNEIRDQDSLKLNVNPNNESQTAALHVNFVENVGQLDYDRSRSYPEQGVALNYVLEFLHNFQNQIQESQFSEKELKDLLNMIKKSIPKDTDIIESTLAAAIKATTKRIQVHLNSSDENTIQDNLVSFPGQKKESIDNNQNSNHYPKAG